MDFILHLYAARCSRVFVCVFAHKCISVCVCVCVCVEVEVGRVPGFVITKSLIHATN